MMRRVYRLLAWLFRQKSPPPAPERILLLKPCCIGDVVMATALLNALHRAYPHAKIVWAVGSWSIGALAGQSALAEVIDLGDGANPAKGLRNLWRCARQLHRAQCDIAFIPDRSPWLGMVAWLAGIPHRIGLDSAGRGFAHTVRLPIHPHDEHHEAVIYLRLAEAIGITTEGIYTHSDIPHDAQATVQALCHARGINPPYVVIHPAGGANPGMVMSSKRWLPQNFAQLADPLCAEYGAMLILIGALSDAPIIQAVQAHLTTPHHTFLGELTFMQIGALAKSAWVYIGNDTGLTHLVAACGAKTVMILGPSSPKRYAPYHPNALALWKPIDLPSGGVADGITEWDWERDGIGVADALEAIRYFLQGNC